MHVSRRMCERERERESNGETEREERSYLYAVLRLRAFGRVGRQKRLGGTAGSE